MPPTVHSEREVRAWFSGHVLDNTELWVAEDATEAIVGVLVLDGDSVEQLYVDPALTGRGIGACLLALAQRRRPDGLTLWTFASNVRAQRFYERHGFVEARRTDGQQNEERAPDILLAWPGTASG